MIFLRFSGRFFMQFFIDKIAVIISRRFWVAATKYMQLYNSDNPVPDLILSRWLQAIAATWDFTARQMCPQGHKTLQPSRLECANMSNKHAIHLIAVKLQPPCLMVVFYRNPT